MQDSQSQKKNIRAKCMLAILVVGVLLVTYVPSFVLPVPSAKAQPTIGGYYDDPVECDRACREATGSGSTCTTERDEEGELKYVCVNPDARYGVDEIAGDVVETFTSPVLNVVVAILVMFSAGLLGVAGVVLNIALDITVVHAADFIRSIGSITLAWELIRDVVNALFIFIILFLAITIILRAERFGGKKMLANIIIAALLINFSFFFTRVIIDASNILTYEFYKPITAAAGGTAAPVNIGTTTAPEVNIGNVNLIGFSAAFMKHLGLVTLFSAEAIDFADLSLVVRQLFVVIFLLVAAFVFFSVGILLIVRFVVFVILLVSSPVMFLGLILPKGSALSQKWWGALWDQALWAPVFMLLASLSYIIISDPTFVEKINNPDLGNLEAAFKGADLIVIAFNFIIVIGFLIAALVIAKSMSAKSAGALVKYADKLTGAASSFVGRNTFGRIARGAGTLYDKQVASRIANSGAARWLQSSRLAKYTGLRTLATGIGKTADTGIREGLRAAETSKYMGVTALADAEKAGRARRIEIARAGRVRERDKKIKDGRRKIEEQLAATPPSFDSAAPEVKTFLEEVGKISVKEIEQMLESDLNLLKDPNFAAALTGEHIEAIMKSELIGDTDKAEIRKARITGIKAQLDKAADREREAARVASGKPVDVAKLPRDVLLNIDPATGLPAANQFVAERLSASVLNQIQRDGKMPDADRAQIRQAINDLMSDPARLGVLSAQDQAKVAKAHDWLTTSPQGRFF
jgi:hypothetical protein